MSFCSIALGEADLVLAGQQRHAADRAQVEPHRVLRALLGRRDRHAGGDDTALVVEVGRPRSSSSDSLASSQPPLELLASLVAVAVDLEARSCRLPHHGASSPTHLLPAAASSVWRAWSPSRAARRISRSIRRRSSWRMLMRRTGSAWAALLRRERDVGDERAKLGVVLADRPASGSSKWATRWSRAHAGWCPRRTGRRLG